MGEIGYIFNLIFTFPILNALMVLYHLFGDFGLSIVILTLVIKLVLFPLTLKQLKSMKAQQALQPQIAEIRKKYGKDQQAVLAQTQAMYKEYGVNPVAGCLPLLVQMPVLYGLFFAIEGLLKTTSNLKTLNSQLYPFVPHFTTLPNTNLDWFTFLNPHWFISLATPDPTHILPILAGVATLIQMRMAQPKGAAANTSGASDPSTQSMKMMQYVSPLIVVFFGWNYAAGLALYWTVSSIFQAVQQYFVTGWGSLMVVPDFLKNQGSNKDNTATTTTVGNTTEKTATSSRTYTGEQRRERELAQRANGSNGHYDHDEGDERTGGQSHTPPARSGSGPSQYNRRRSRSNASARRRSTQRSRS